MNNLGYSNDNLHIGDVRIKGQGETLRVGNENGGDGYILPTVKGNDGDVLTMNADNSTSFQPIPSSAERICVNRWYSMNQSGKAGTGQGTILYNITDGPTTSLLGRFTTGNNVIPASDLSETGNNFTTMYLQIRNIVDNVDPLQANINQLILVLTTGGITSQIEFELMDYTGLNTSPTSIETAVEHYISFSRLPTQPSNVYISIKGVKATNEVSSTLPNSTNADKPFHSHNQLKLGSETGNLQLVAGSGANSTACVLTNYVNGDDITVDIQATRGTGTPNTIITNLVMGRMDTYITKTLAGGAGGGGGGGTSDHLLLSNLNGGPFLDGGHINMFLINGTKPMTGNINLNGNNMINTAVVSGNNGDLDFTLTETHLNSNNDLHLESASNFNTEVRIQGTGEFKVVHGGGDRFVVANNLITASRNIDMNSNNIREVNEISSATISNRINFDVGGNNELQLSSIYTRIGDFSTSGNSLYIDSNVAQLFGTSSVDLLASKVNIFSPLDMNNNDIINSNKLTMNNTLAEHPIIVYLPALASDFSGTPYNNVLVTINASGNIRPIAYGDPDNTGVIGVTDEIITTDGLKRVQVGGICTFTPAPAATINAGTKFEKTNAGVPILFGTIMAATGVGTCGIALTSGTGDATGSVKILGMWTKNEHF